MVRPKTLTPKTRVALNLLGGRVEEARRERRWTVAELADRVGVSRVTMTRVLAGDPGVAVGTVLEAAVIVGVPLFSDDSDRLASEAARVRDRLAVLPRYTRKPAVFDDDF